jgi:Domain of unknown function (DUF4116)
MSLTKNQFIDNVGDKQFYKVLRNDLTHYGFEYQLGTNKNSFTGDKGGMTFIDLHHLIDVLHYGSQIGFVKLEDDAEFNIKYNKYTTNKFTITSIINIPEFLDYFLSNDSDFVKKVLAKYPCYFYFMNQKPELCLYLVENNGLSLKYIKNKTPELCLMAVRENSDALQFVDDQSTMICMIAIKNDYSTIRHVKNQTHELCCLAIEQDLLALQHIKHITPQLFHYASEKNYNILRFGNQTYELCRAAVTQNGLLLKFVKKEFRTKELYMIAIKQNGLAIQYVDEQTLELCQLAYQVCPMAIQYIKDINCINPNTTESMFD